MQDKALDAMAKKYKEEMMRLYAGGRPSAPNQPSAPQAMTVKPSAETVNGTSGQPREQTAKKDTDRLMHPPMPKIPSIPQKNEEKTAENLQSQKFPTPEEIMAGHTAREAEQNASPAENAGTVQNESAPRFDSAGGQTSEQEHEQGNYDFTEAEQERMFDCGEGCLKLEVSCGGQPVDCALALVFRITDCGDLLVATFFTDEKGETEVITLPVPKQDENYTVTVAKEGFFTVHSLEIPIFDGIKSIQPVELKQEQK